MRLLLWVSLRVVQDILLKIFIGLRHQDPSRMGVRFHHNYRSVLTFTYFLDPPGSLTSNRLSVMIGITRLMALTVKQFDEQIGLKYLCGMHLNDSKTEQNSKKDRHENIGL